LKNLAMLILGKNIFIIDYNIRSKATLLPR
jgi:hypothetical protein